MFLLLIVAFLSASYRSLTCYAGTAPVSTCVVDPVAGQDACLSAVFQTPLVPGNGTVVYSCGNCSVFQSAPFVTNVTCCSAADLCQTLAPPPVTGSCEALANQSSCTARGDCYWCTASIFGFGLCQSFLGFTLPGTGVSQLPAYALHLVVPPPVCASIAFQPFSPAYTVQYLTLRYLQAYGFPSAVTANLTVGVGVALDVLARQQATRVLNDTDSFCAVDEELRVWCGVNTSTPFAYCVIAETWPQPDVWGWLSNSTFTSPASSLSPIYPAFCACPVAGRAYYVPTRGVDARPHYNPQCGVESTLLACYILLILAHAAAFVAVLWDAGVFVLFVFQRKKKFTIGATFFVKVLLVGYFLVAIPSLVVQAVPARGRNAMFITQGVLNVLAIVAVYCAFSQAIFCFMQILINIEFFGTRRYTQLLAVFRWVFFVAALFMACVILAILSALSYYTEQLADYNVQNLTQLASLVQDTVAPLGRALVLSLMITQGVTLCIGAALLLLVGVLLFRMKNLRGMGDLLARFIGLAFALCLSVPDMAMLIMVCYFTGWITFGPNVSPWDSFYLTLLANAWFTWALFAAQLLWVGAIAYAMRTVVKKSWLVGQFRSLLSAVTSRSATASDLTLSTESAVTQHASFED